MNKLFGLFLLALACWAPSSADAAARFLICSTTCTLDASNTGIWSTTSGGGTGASVPTTTDDVTLDASTCVGGTTCTATFGAGYNPTWLSLTMSACTASTAGCILDANPNTNTITLTVSGNAYINTGAGTRTLSGGTWILSGNAPVWNVAASATITNNPNINLSGTGGSSGRKTFTAGGKTYGTVTLASSAIATDMGSSATIGTLTVGAGNEVHFNGGATTTVTTITNVSGNSSSQTLFITSSVSLGIATVSSANNWTCDWCGFSYMAFTGGGTFAATNSSNYRLNTGITISPPAGGGGGRIIGG